MFVEIAAPARSVTAATPRRPARSLAPYLYLAPGLVLLGIWVYRPLAQTAALAFYSWNLLPTAPMVPVGWDNFTRLFTLPEFAESIGRTLVLVLGLLPFTVLVPVAVGLLARRVRGRVAVVYQTLVFAPLLIAPVAGAAVWQWLLDPRSGAINQVLGTTTNWLQEPGPAQLVIIAITGWHVLGFAVLVVAAGLAGINDDYAHAAAVDGATRGQITRWITLPMLSPTVVFLVLMTVLLAAQWSFPLIDTLTKGGPAGATTNVYYLLWDYGFHSFDAGLGAAAGMIFFGAFCVIAAGLVWLSEKVAFHDN